ncbi:MAG: thioredoxin family protein [Anaerolineae bacterium]|nr:thioredoxin family protein [Anaerolineae bacterium]
MEKLINQDVAGQITKAFEELENPVQILFFSSNEQCEYCNETQQLLTEISELDSRISLSIHDLVQDAAVAATYQITKAPGIVVAGKDGDTIMDLGIQFSGIPSGYEFSTLITDILLASKRDSGLGAETREFLKTLTTPLLLQVFVTPTCPYCPQAVLLAHKMAMENPSMIRAEAVEATEFPELANQFRVQGVPQTVINSGKGTAVGAYPEARMLAEIKNVLQN